LNEQPVKSSRAEKYTNPFAFPAVPVAGTKPMVQPIQLRFSQDDDEAKARCYEQVSAFCWEKKATSVILIWEGWASTNVNGNLAPSEDPDRFDVLCITTVQPDGYVSNQKTLPFRRTTTGVVWDDPLAFPGEKTHQHVLPAWE
jgi:hypothetical protein